MLVKRSGRVRGYRIAARLTLTSPADLLALNRHYLVNGNSKHHSLPQHIGANTRLVPPIYIESGVVIGAIVKSDRMYILSGAVILMMERKFVIASCYAG